MRALQQAMPPHHGHTPCSAAHLSTGGRGRSRRYSCPRMCPQMCQSRLASHSSTCWGGTQGTPAEHASGATSLERREAVCSAQKLQRVAAACCPRGRARMSRAQAGWLAGSTRGMRARQDDAGRQGQDDARRQGQAPPASPRNEKGIPGDDAAQAHRKDFSIVEGAPRLADLHSHVGRHVADGPSAPVSSGTALATYMPASHAHSNTARDGAAAIQRGRQRPAVAGRGRQRPFRCALLAQHRCHMQAARSRSGRTPS